MLHQALIYQIIRLRVKKNLRNFFACREMAFSSREDDVYDQKLVSETQKCLNGRQTGTGLVMTAGEVPRQLLRIVVLCMFGSNCILWK